MSKIFTTKNITRLAIFSAFAFILYMWVKFPLPFLFPSFLDFQVSELPALLAGFMIGPVGGCIVIVIKCLLKLPFTSTAGVGELGDLLLGIAFVLVSSLIYRKHRSKKGAVISLICGSLACTAVSVVVNAFILIPFYAEAFGMSAIVGMLSSLFPTVTEDTIMLYYLPLSVLPFNLLRCTLSSVITFLVYKRLQRLLDRIFEPQQKHLSFESEKCIIDSMETQSEQQTEQQGFLLGERLVGGEIILLNGDLGAGKTVFTRGVAAALGITDSIVSPTFTLMNCYEGRLKLYHYDAYRLDSAEQAEERGLTEFFGASDGVCIIEWPEKISEAIPQDVIRVTIKYIDEQKREITIC
ncbi:MAG: tRNA (adenosine(37)-N6)-threonylcarbamoyltransferase complex ATPase subunit type 1 TsaE [Clostridiales bacterium]|nr:tRNA (adenosine(37)-N6)-threonylcarbamoyltransferase complex ATPase subunit type 1 TsaE [Clostridiales bacterium]